MEASTIQFPFTLFALMKPFLILKSVFAGEDSPMLAAQQQRIGNADFWDLQPALLPIDAGAVRVRRRMDELLAAENAR